MVFHSGDSVHDDLHKRRIVVMSMSSKMVGFRFVKFQVIVEPVRLKPSGLISVIWYGIRPLISAVMVACLMTPRHDAPVWM